MKSPIVHQFVSVPGVVMGQKEMTHLSGIYGHDIVTGSRVKVESGRYPFVLIWAVVSQQVFVKSLP